MYQWVCKLDDRRCSSTCLNFVKVQQSSIAWMVTNFQNLICARRDTRLQLTITFNEIVHNMRCKMMVANVIKCAQVFHSLLQLQWKQNQLKTWTLLLFYFYKYQTANTLNPSSWNYYFHKSTQIKISTKYPLGCGLRVFSAKAMLQLATGHRS